jgi:hypothetical protein
LLTPSRGQYLLHLANLANLGRLSRLGNQVSKHPSQALAQTVTTLSITSRHPASMAQPAVTSTHHFGIFQPSQQTYTYSLSYGGKSSFHLLNTTSIDTVIRTPEAVNETLTERVALRPQPFEVPAQFNCAETGPTMASTATFQDWSPYGFTSFYHPPTSALGWGLGELLLNFPGSNSCALSAELANDVKQSTDFQSSIGTLMPLMGTYNGSLRLPDTYGLTGTQQPQSVSSSLPEHLNPQAISPSLPWTDPRVPIDRTSSSHVQDVAIHTSYRRNLGFTSSKRLRR